MLLQDPHAGWKLLHATLQRGERIRDFEFGILTKGRLLTLSLSGRPIIDEKTGQLLYYRGVGRDVTRENHQNLLLRLAADIVKLLQELDAQGQDESVVVREVITLVCRTLNWAGGLHMRPVPESSRVTIEEKCGTPAVQEMLSALGKEMLLLANSPEAMVLREGALLWLHRKDGNSAEFYARYQMELVGHPFYLFIEKSSKQPCAVYHRHGWTYGVIRLDAQVL